MTRAVIIGFAHMHVNEIAQYISDHKDFELIGFADIPADRPETTDARYTRAWNIQNNRDKYGLTPYEDYTQMLDELKPDIAFILCENYRKRAVVEECAKRGVNVSIEKPMATSYAEALEIQEIVARYGIEAMVNWPVVWRPHIHRQIAALHSGVAGKLIKAFFCNGHTGPLGKGAKHRGVTEKAQEMTDDERASTWWYQKETGGGALLDIGCYGCFYNEWVRDENDRPLTVMAFAGNYNTPYMNAPDNMAGIIEYKDSYGVVEGTWTTPQVTMPIGPVYCCTDGVLYCTPDAQVKFTNIYGEEVDLPELSIEPHIANIVDHYADCKKHGKALLKPLTLDFNVKLMSLIDAAMRSTESGKKEIVR